MKSCATFISQPVSGEFREKIFDIPESDFTIRNWSWVLLTKSDGTEWVASFHGGQGSRQFVDVFRDTPIAFVISHGQGYFINVEAEELLHHTKEDSIREAVVVDDIPLAIYADSWNIFAVDMSLKIKNLPTPFEFYSVQFGGLTEVYLQINYEEGYTWEMMKTYLNTEKLEFSESDPLSD